MVRNWDHCLLGWHLSWLPRILAKLLKSFSQSQNLYRSTKRIEAIEDVFESIKHFLNEFFFLHLGQLIFVDKKRNFVLFDLACSLINNLQSLPNFLSTRAFFNLVKLRFAQRIVENMHSFVVVGDTPFVTFIPLFFRLLHTSSIDRFCWHKWKFLNNISYIQAFQL